MINVPYTKAVYHRKLHSGPRRIHIILRNWNIIHHTPQYALGWRVNICSDHISLMVLLIRTLIWTCCKSGSGCNRKALALRIMPGSNMMGLAVWEYLSEVFWACWFGCGSPALPASLDWSCHHVIIYFWGILKETVAQQLYKTTEYLKQAVRLAYDHVTSQILHYMSPQNMAQNYSLSWEFCHEYYWAQTFPHDNYGLYSML